MVHIYNRVVLRLFLLLGWSWTFSLLVVAGLYRVADHEDTRTVDYICKDHVWIRLWSRRIKRRVSLGRILPILEN
ncbi:hypothetical protein D3C80_1597720 [compost metagenome]